MKDYIWNATTSANNAKNIWILLATLSYTIPYLAAFFFISKSVSTGTNTNVKAK